MQKLTKNVYALGSPMAWVYFVDAPKPVIVDTGFTAQAEFLEAELKELLGERPLYGIAHTHSHFDHVGCTAYLAQKFSAQFVWGHPLFEKVFANERAIESMVKLNRGISKMFGGTGPVFEAPDAWTYIECGQTVDLGDGIELRLHATPGHTRDSVTIQVWPDNVCVPGEATGVPQSSAEDIQVEFLTDFRDYADSIRLIQTLEPEVIGIPHNFYIEGKEESARFLERSLECTDEYVERLFAIAREHNNDEQKIYDQVFEEDFVGGKTGQPEAAYALNLQAQVRCIVRENSQKV